MTAPAPVVVSSLRRRPIVLLLALGLVAGLMLAGGWLAWNARLEAGRERLRADGAARLAGEAASLMQLFDKHRHLPRLLAMDPRLLTVLGPDRPASAVDVVNRHLTSVGQQLDLQAVFLMDRQGLVLAASNWDTPASFVGWNYTFRPYFRDAMAAGAGVFYAVGVTTEAPGLFLSQALRDAQGRAVGVVVVKIGLGALERAWATGGEPLALADERGVLFLASREDWRYRTLAPLTLADRAALAESRQYGWHDLQRLPELAPLAALWPPVSPGGLQRDVIDSEGRHLLQAHRLEAWGWTLLLAADLRPVHRAAAIEAAALGLLGALAVAGGGLWWLQRRRLDERRHAALALEALQKDLAQQVAGRTAELMAANETLHQRIEALNEAERILQATRDQAVQAGKLAVLGQLAAGVTHEINQPLAALATCADNALKQLDRGRHADLRESLSLVGELAGRLGALVAPLKGFARAGSAICLPVAVTDALDMAETMLAPRLRETGVTIARRIAADAGRVLADRVRLEQVLVNLLSNALDAMAAAGVCGRVEIDVDRRSDGRIALQVRDHGQGLSSSASEHLFEPFFTTRSRGLGLGLVISRAIAQGLGGELSGGNVAPEAGSGAIFTLVLPAPSPSSPESSA